MRCTIQFDMTSAAFDEDDASREANRILRKLANEIRDYASGPGETTIYDINGNRIGRMVVGCNQAEI